MNKPPLPTLLHLPTHISRTCERAQIQAHHTHLYIQKAKRKKVARPYGGMINFIMSILEKEEMLAIVFAS